ncbi:MAG: glycoside hydrolase family 16 protein [Bacteroidales bacterium]|jgi:beta-glucanase (GH16 family)|nr:glycoside hydrolase family 16 protein [Bacteroidales bacterium]
MKKIYLITMVLLIHHVIVAQTPKFNPNDPAWRLLFEDHFDGNSINESIWLVANHATHTAQPQLYTKTNVSVSNGNLVIKVNNDATTCSHTSLVWTGACWYCEPGVLYNYTSGWIETKPEYSVQFGYIEARIKFPYRQNYGFFPAFWTSVEQGDYGGRASEIDICEIFGSRDNPYEIATNAHACYNERDPANCFQDEAGAGLLRHTLATPYTEWHTYAVEWDADWIIYFVDGKPIRILGNDNIGNSNNHIADPVRVILNLAIQKEEDHPFPPTSPRFEEYMYVDYVKVYQLNYGCREVVNEIDFNTYNYAVKKSISLSGATTIPQGGNITLKASDFIELKNGFEVPLGTELSLEIHSCEY